MPYVGTVVSVKRAIPSLTTVPYVGTPTVPYTGTLWSKAGAQSIPILYTTVYNIQERRGYATALRRSLRSASCH